MGFFLPIANLIDLILENWIISAAVLAVFASLCLGLFKGAKHGIRAMGVLLAVAITALAGMLIYYFAAKDIEGLIKFGIAWFPTIIFLIAVTLSTLVGIHRGLRKSLILMLHSVLIAGLCLGLFFFCVTSTTFDRLLLSFINMFLGENGLQNQVGVSSECETVREVLMDFIGSYVVDLGEFGILLGANSAYVLALVNMIYRLVFAFIFFLIYELLLFIMYVIYLIFYSERKYKKKRDIHFAMSKADSSYKKRPVGGGCVGLVRGMISGIISLSFIGSVFFIAVGGTGASKLPEDFSFGDSSNPIISIYRSIEDYGDQGIFKILNAINDPEDTPYYLFAADIIFSGGLDDELHDVRGTVRFRKELAAYTGFAKNTLALLLKYDTNGEIASILSGGGGGNTMESVLNVFTKHEFRVEFENLIDNFDSQTYIINFALSLADAVIANVDNVSFMQSLSADNKELLQVLFRRNYLCDTIPDEHDRKLSATGEETEEIQPYININHLLTKRDAQIVLDIVLSIIANEIDVQDPHSIAKQLIPDIEELSIISSRRSAEMDPVLGRMYCYFENKYLTNEGERGITYAEVKNESVKWTRELRALLSVADGLVSMYDKVQNRGESNLFNTVMSLFDEDNEDYEENVLMYEELTEVVSDSAIMSKVLCSGKIYNFLNTQLKNINENVYYPQKISYANTYDEAGNLVAHGEAYQLLRGLRLMAEKDNREIIDSLTGSATFEDLIKKLASTVTREDPYAQGNSLASYMTESTLFRSVLSTFIMEKAGDMLVVPRLSLETDAYAKRVNLINKYELREILDALPELTDLILPLAEENVGSEAVNNILKNEVFRSLLDNGNKIVEGTIAKSLINMLIDNDEIIITRRLESYEEWVTVDAPGELRKFLKTKDILELDVESLMNGEGLNGTEILNSIKNLDDANVSELFDSDVFYYSASRMLDRGEFKFEDFEVIVTTSSCKPLEDEKIPRVIKKDELMSVFINLKNFGLTSGMNSENILRKLVEQHEVLDDSDIISASVVNFIVNNEKTEIREALSIPEFYINEATKERLRAYDTANPWRAELPSLIAAIDEIFGLSNMPEDEEFVFNSDNTSSKTKNILMLLNENSATQPRVKKLDVCYASEIIQNIISKELDKALNGSDDADESLIDKAARDSLKTSTRAVWVYPKSEIGNLITGLNALGFDNIDAVKADRFDSLSQYGSKIKIISTSGIIRGIITKKIDAAITDGEGGIIETKVKSQIKRKNGLVYTAAEITSLVNALDEFGMNDFAVLNSYDFSENMKNLNGPSKTDDEATKLSVIYRSDIVAGILTKTVKDVFTDPAKQLTYHTSAERADDMSVLKEQELTALIALLGGNNLGDFRVGVISLASVRSQLEPDKSGNPKSYLIAANFAKTVIGNEYLYVPSSAYRNGIISPSESVCFIDAVIAMQGGGETLDGWNVNASMVLPDGNDREKVLASVIMRATFSHTVLTINENAAFSQQSIRFDNRVDTGTEIAIISAAQLEALFGIIEGVGSGRQLAIPVFTDSASIINSGVNLDLLCEFDATRYSISQILLPLGTPAEESWCKFTSGGYTIDRAAKIFTAEQIKSILQR